MLHFWGDSMGPIEIRIRIWVRQIKNLLLSQVPTWGIVAALFLAISLSFVATPYSFHPIGYVGLRGYVEGIGRVVLVRSFAYFGGGWGAMTYALLFMIAYAVVMRIRHPKAFKEHLLKQVLYFIPCAVAAWIPFGVFSAIREARDQYTHVYLQAQSLQESLASAQAAKRTLQASTEKSIKDAKEHAAQSIEDLRNESSTLKGRLGSLPNINDQAFQHTIQLINAFELYRGAIRNRECQMIITYSSPEQKDMVDVVMAIATKFFWM
jgi:hypothetical protein